MADREDNTSMYCHVCHHTWTRDGDCIQCPQCTSSSTEMVRHIPNPDLEPDLDEEDGLELEITIISWLLTIDQITPEHDPRLFHNRPQEQPATPMDVDTPVDTTPADAPSAPMDTTDQGEQQTSDQGSETTSSNNDNSSSNNDHNNDNSNAHARGSQPIRFTAISFPTGVTLITTVIGDQPPPPILMPGPVPVPFFGWHFMHPPRHSPSPAEDNGASQQPQAENAQSDTQQQQSENSQQQPAESQPATTGTQPQPATGNPQPSRQAQMVDAILTMLLNPAAAIMGDAVYSQEAFDRVMTMLRSQMPTGGAPPASQAAIEKLVVKELDEKMLGTEGTSKCVVCVEDMVIGEKATFLPCNHFFHGECVTPWLKEHNTCPVCRRSVEQEETVKSKIVEFGPERPSQMMQHSDHGQDSMDCS